MSRAEVDDHSMWEFTAAVEGWKRTHGADEGPAAPTNEEFDAAKRAHGMM